eukprot:5308715-Prymnesium_polylepis.2
MQPRGLRKSRSAPAGRPCDVDAMVRTKGSSVQALQHAVAMQDALLVRSKARTALAFVRRALDRAARASFDGKAMMVVRSRQHCAAFHRAFLRL